MNKMMNLKTTVLVLGVLLSSASYAADTDPNTDRAISGADVLKVGSSVSADVCECNTVGGTLLPKADPNRADYLLNGDSGKPATPSSGAGGVDN